MEYEADPRQAEFVAQSCGVSNSRVMTSPGTNDMNNTVIGDDLLSHSDAICFVPLQHV